MAASTGTIAALTLFASTLHAAAATASHPLFPPFTPSLRRNAKQVIRQAKPDRLFIEVSGLAHPSALLATLGGPHLGPALALAPIVCALDARRTGDFDPLFPPSEALMDQINCADVVVGTFGPPAAPGGEASASGGGAAAAAEGGGGDAPRGFTEAAAGFRDWAEGLRPAKAAALMVEWGAAGEAAAGDALWPLLAGGRHDPRFAALFRGG
jgi:hypothetical protein